MNKLYIDPTQKKTHKEIIQDAYLEVIVRDLKDWDENIAEDYGDMEHIEFIMEIEKALQISIHDDEGVNLTTPNRMLEYLNRVLPPVSEIKLDRLGNTSEPKLEKVESQEELWSSIENVVSDEITKYWIEIPADQLAFNITEAIKEKFIITRKP